MRTDPIIPFTDQVLAYNLSSSENCVEHFFLRSGVRQNYLIYQSAAVCVEDPKLVGTSQFGFLISATRCCFTMPVKLYLIVHV